MRREIEDFFLLWGIEYFGAVDYRFVREINPSLAQRSGINAKSVIVFLLPYYTGNADNISIYSASKDYHLIIKKTTDSLIALLREFYPENNFCGFGDHSPIDEIGAALSLGLGIFGRNGLIINEKYGSYVFVADVITDIEPNVLGVNAPIPILMCDGCGACANACPTGILRGESGSCLSAITQTKGELSDEDVALMRKHNTVWGCDICQRVCHYNNNPKKTPIAFFYEDRIERLTSDLVESMSDDEFRERAFAWRGRKTVLRNLKYLDM